MVSSGPMSHKKQRRKTVNEASDAAAICINHQQKQPHQREGLTL